MSAADILKTIKEKEVEYVDLRFTDPRGKLQHLTQDISTVDEGMLKDGVFLMVRQLQVGKRLMSQIRF